MTPGSTTPAEALRDPAIVRSEALLLLTRATGRTRESLLASPDIALTAAQAAVYADLRHRRAGGEPIAYLLGFREFYGRPFAVDRRVLIPRPETELLIDLAVARHGSGRPAVLDLGTGSGIVAITLALEIPQAQVTGTDRSPDALEVARANAASLHAVVAWRSGSWFDALGDAPARFDLIVSNPPYIAATDRHLHEGDLRYEPLEALTEGHDGLAAIRRITDRSTAHLKPDGTLMVEHGHDQALSVRALFEAAGLCGVATVRDLAGIERVTFGRLG